MIPEFKALPTTEPITSVARRYGVTVQSIAAIRDGKSWRSVTGYPNPRLRTE